MSEPLADTLRRWWEDTDTLRQADPDELETARLEALERLDVEITAHGADLDQRGAELRDLRARAVELRRRLES